MSAALSARGASGAACAGGTVFRTPAPQPGRATAAQPDRATSAQPDRASAGQPDRASEPAALARNMSAPARTTLTFTALAPTSGATGDAVADGTGLAFVCRLDIRALLPTRKRERDPARIASREVHMVHNRLRVALVHALAEAAKRRQARAGALAQACAMPGEQVADELERLLAAHPLADDSLPRIGLLLPPDAAPRPVLSSLIRTLAILARRRGSVFLRDADPIVWSAVDGDVLDLWSTVASVRSSA